MGHIRLLFSCLAICLSLTACSRGSSTAVEPQADASAQLEPAKTEDVCPINVPATTVTVVNTKSGVAMFFTTTSSNVDEVRRRVTEVAKVDTSKPPGSQEPPVEGRPEMPDWVFGEQPKLVPLQAKVEEVSDGASLVLTPLDPSDAEELRAYAHSNANRMRLGRCPADFMKMPSSVGQNAELPHITLGGAMDSDGSEPFL
jgi:hypothetical protein